MGEDGVKGKNKNWWTFLFEFNTLAPQHIEFNVWYFIENCMVDKFKINSNASKINSKSLSLFNLSLSHKLQDKLKELQKAHALPMTTSNNKEHSPLCPVLPRQSITSFFSSSGNNTSKYKNDLKSRMSKTSIWTGLTDLQLLYWILSCSWL